jgi:hypothetical protein
MNQRKLIRELFFSTNKCNRSLAFELAKSTHCHAEVVEEFYRGLSELPHFMLLVNSQQISKEYPAATKAAEVSEEEQQQAYIEQFCDLYFQRSMNLNGYHLSSSTANYLTYFPEILLHCTFLEELDLSHNNLEEIPTDIGRLYNLQYLNLSSNPKIKRLPNSMCQLKELKSLNLSGIFDLFAVELSDYRVLHAFPPVLRELRQLQHLNLQDVMVDELPAWVYELAELESLHLFSGSRQHPQLMLPSSFSKLSRLKTLTIDAFTVSIPENICEISSLECLVVNHAKQVPASISRLPHLRYLDLSYLSPDFLLAKGAWRRLEELPDEAAHSRLALFGWEWLLEMTGLEEFIYKHVAPYKFTSEDIATLQKALPNCSFSFD